MPERGRGDQSVARQAQRAKPGAGGHRVNKPSPRHSGGTPVRTVHDPRKHVTGGGGRSGRRP